MPLNRRPSRGKKRKPPAAELRATLLERAEAGDVDAMKLLAEHHVSGEFADHGIPRDWNTAAGLYERAAEAGDVPAMVRFGWLLAEHEPVSTDIFVQGLAWLKAAARSGNAEGQYLYALALRRYEEEAEARVWLARAADDGWAPAQALLDTL